MTVTGLVPLCGPTSSLMMGKAIHGLICRIGLDINVYVSSALIDTYSRCSSVIQARNIFDSILVKNVASWNAMIGCYGKNGMVDLSVQLFEMM